MNTKQALELAFLTIYPDAKFFKKEPFKPIIWWPVLISILAAIGTWFFMDDLSESRYGELKELNETGTVIVFLICAVIGLCPLINDKIRASWTQLFNLDAGEFDAEEHAQAINRLEQLIGERNLPDDDTISNLIVAYQVAMLEKARNLAKRQSAVKGFSRLQQIELDRQRFSLATTHLDGYRFGLNKEGWESLAEVFKELEAEKISATH